VKISSQNAAPPSPLLSVGKSAVLPRDGSPPSRSGFRPQAHWLCGSAAAHCGKASPFRAGFSKLSEAQPQKN
jgi:hypothetical protein